MPLPPIRQNPSGHWDWPGSDPGRLQSVVQKRTYTGRRARLFAYVAAVSYNLFQLINSVYEYRSIILTTNKDFTSWGEFFHDDNDFAVPIIVRVIHHSRIFMLGGESYRLKEKVSKT